MADYSPEVETLADIADRLAELITVVAATRGAQVTQPPRAPRPVTAYDQVRRQRREDRHLALVARVLPPDPS